MAKQIKDLEELTQAGSSDRYLVQKASNNKYVHVRASDILVNNLITKDYLAGSDSGFTDPDNVQWHELGRHTLSSSSDTLSVTPILSFKNLKVIVFTIPSGGTTTHRLRFNNDSGNNYSNRASDNGAADGTATSSSSVSLEQTATNSLLFTVFFVINLTDQEKVIYSHSIGQNAFGAGTAPIRREACGKWVNTTNAISRVDVLNTGTGDFASGSELIVLGSN